MIIKWFSHIGTLISLIASFITYSNGNKFLTGILICLAIIAFITTIIYEYKLHMKVIHKFNNEFEINQYMIKLIKEEGRATIFTNDMSWAQSSQYVNRVLEEKSQKEELSIILYKRSDFTNNLERLGARIYTYHDTGYIPTIRFTIVKSGRIDSKVAIGKQEKGRHSVEEFSAKDGYPLHFANDLCNLIIKYNEKEGRV